MNPNCPSWARESWTVPTSPVTALRTVAGISLSLNLVEGEFPSIEASFDVPVDQLLAGVSELAKNYRFTFLRDLTKYAMNTPPC